MLGVLLPDIQLARAPGSLPYREGQFQKIRHSTEHTSKARLCRYQPFGRIFESLLIFGVIARLFTAESYRRECNLSHRLTKAMKKNKKKSPFIWRDFDVIRES